MDKTSFLKTAVKAADGTHVRMVYDQEADILEIFFGQNETGTGVELTEHILLRVNFQTRRPISITVLHFSILTEHTEYGPRSFALDKLNELPEALRELVLHVLNTMPVRQFLKTTHYQASPTKQIPVTYVESQPALNAA
jgi:hypothetical protein